MEECRREAGRPDSRGEERRKVWERKWKGRRKRWSGRAALKNDTPLRERERERERKGSGMTESLEMGFGERDRGRIFSSFLLLLMVEAARPSEVPTLFRR